MKAPSFWSSSPGALSLALSPLAALYANLGKLRFSLATPSHCGRPVICIGNINLGGTGKTPVTMMIADMLGQAGRKPAVLSRGYGGSETGPLLVNPDAHSAAEVGDEPLMMSAHIPVVISPDRHRSARYAISNPSINADILLMDDGLQNPALSRAYNLAVIDAEIGFGNGKVFPAGPLREKPETALRRLDAVILVHPNPEAKKNIRDDVTAFKEHCQIFEIDVFNCVMQPKTPLQPTTTENIIGYCGIGRPQKFFNTLTQLGFKTTHTMSFSDHHPYTEEDAERLLELAAEQNAQLVTTRKDLARMLHAAPTSLLAKLSAKSHIVDIICQLEQPELFRKALEAAIAEDMMSRLYTNL